MKKARFEMKIDPITKDQLIRATEERYRLTGEKPSLADLLTSCAVEYAESIGVFRKIEENPNQTRML